MAAVAELPEQASTPTTLKLKLTMLRHGIRHEELAATLPRGDGTNGLSRTAVVRMLSNGYRPARSPWEEIQRATEKFLAERGVPAEEIAEIWEEGAAQLHSWKPLRQADANDNDNAIEIETEMLSAQAKRHFNLFRDPFVDDVAGPEDLFLSADQRYVREAMYQAARGGGWFIAVVGESGSGKTTLRRETIDRIGREGLPVIIVQPRAFDKTVLNAGHLCTAILSDVKPSEKPARSLEALARQVERALTESGRSGQSHVLMIEEAHDLNIQTLKYLKRFWEMEDGFKKLLSIVLIGQPELKDKLNERQYFEAREVIRRCEIVELMPLDGQVPDYLALKFKRQGVDLARVIDQGAFEAIRARLTYTGRGQQRNQTVSMTYPLVVNNLVTKAMNYAAEIGAQKVTADIIKGC